MYSNQDNTSSSNIRFNPSKDGQYGSNADVGTKPTGDPRSTKDFKKVLRKVEKDKDNSNDKVTDKKEDGDGEDGAISCPVDDLEQTEKPETPALSLFDLSRKQSARHELAFKDKAELKGTDSPSQVFSKMTAKNAKKVDSDDVPTEEVAPEPVKKDKYTTRFDTEQTDLSYVNPLGLASQGIQNLGDIQAKRPMSATQIQEIIEQMVKSLNTIRDSGKTDTVLTLKHPPIFDGANVVITAYDSAKGEFNVAFENLTQAAKQLLDMRTNQESLRQALEARGYAVHIVVTTTLVENRPIAEATPPSSGEQRQREGEGGEEREEGRGQQR